MRLDARPVPLVRIGEAYRGSPMKTARLAYDREIVLTTPSGLAPRLGALGFDPFGAVAGVVGTIIGGNQAKDAAKTTGKYNLKMKELDIAAYREGAKMALEAEKYKAGQQYQMAALDADTSALSLRTQRAAMIDAQATQLVANTQNGIFRLSSTGIVEAADATTSWSRSAVWGTLLLTLAFIAANSSFRRKKKPDGTMERAA